MSAASSVSVCGGGKDSGKGDNERGGGAVDAAAAEATALRCVDSSSSPALSAASLAEGKIFHAGRVGICTVLQAGESVREKTQYFNREHSREPPRQNNGTSKSKASGSNHKVRESKYEDTQDSRKAYPSERMGESRGEVTTFDGWSKCASG